ncbi:MAG: hypothetical protein IRA32_01730, partial [Xanthomonas citri pv. citri]
SSLHTPAQSADCNGEAAADHGPDPAASESEASLRLHRHGCTHVLAQTLDNASSIDANTIGCHPQVIVMG